MLSARDRLEAMAPGPLFNTIRGLYRTAWKAPAWRFSPKRRASAARLDALRDRHRGERCFVIGNGPSLRQTDLSKLARERTFGLNRIYLKFDELGFATTYHVCVNRLVVEQCAREIEAVPCPKFIGWESRRAIRFTDDMVFLRSLAEPHFAADPRDGLWYGATVTFAAIQLAWWMGFDPVILIGVDHDFATKGPANATVVSGGDDPNHFDPRYFGKGFRWQLPDLEVSEMAYRIAQQHFQGGGRRILDATLGGKLRVFERVDYDGLFQA